jgi:hypothetical protein
VRLQETEGGYINTFEVGKTPLLSIQVTVDYGRNDAIKNVQLTEKGYRVLRLMTQLKVELA